MRDTELGEVPMIEGCCCCLLSLAERLYADGASVDECEAGAGCVGADGSAVGTDGKLSSAYA
jgi:hypothetical protein